LEIERRMTGPLEMLDRAVGRIVGAAAALALPLALLLFLQWPLREWVQLWSREANDLGQILFAFYSACAVTYATRARTHLSVDTWTEAAPAQLRAATARLLNTAAVAWSAWMIWVVWPATRQSVLQLEGFPETFNPGYFALRLALVLLLALLLAQSLLDAVRGPRPSSDA
jgi:TRAP-type C4-dicarboxylate transport system permease small subunit